MARKINPHTHTDWRRWYASYEWRRRAHRQMANEPLCAMCLAEGRVVPAEVADHVERVDGDYTRFRLGKLQSLCKAHHERSKDHVESMAFDPILALTVGRSIRHIRRTSASLLKRGARGRVVKTVSQENASGVQLEKILSFWG